LHIILKLALVQFLNLAYAIHIFVLASDVVFKEMVVQGWFLKIILEPCPLFRHRVAETQQRFLQS
jgi:hypothetical protein